MLCMHITFISGRYLNQDAECREEGRRDFYFQSSLSSEHIVFSLKKRRSNQFYFLAWCFLSYTTFVLHCGRRLLSWSFTSTLSPMATKIKGIYKGFKYISQIFVVKEREMEIGYPTDVKHVAHIGWDGPSGSAAPSWINEFKTGPDFATASIGNSRSALSPWSPQDFGDSLVQPIGQTETYRDEHPTSMPKKHRRRKNKSSSSPRSVVGSSRASLPSAKSKAKYVESSANKPTNIEVA